MRKFKQLLLLSLLVMLAFPGYSFAQTTIEGVTLKSTLTLDGHELVYNGAGVRKKWFFKLYVGAVYLPQPVSSGAMIVKADYPMMIQLNIISDLIDSKKMIEAVTEGFEKSTRGNTAPIQEEINLIIEAFAEEITSGDTFDLMYVPRTGVKVYKNGKVGVTIPGIAFKEALFGIWLGSDPVNDELKDEMLGK